VTAARLESGIEALAAIHASDRRLGVWEVAVEEREGALFVSGAVSEPAALQDVESLAREANAGVAVELLPAGGPGAAIRGIAHRSLAHLRAEPRHAAELVSQMILGEEGLVLRERGEWLQVQTTDRYVAWVHRRSLVRDSPADPEEFRARLFEGRPPPGRWVVTARGARAVAEPAPYAAPVADLVQGGIVEVPEIRGRFVRVVLPDGETGWVGRGDAVPAERLSERFTPSGRAILDHGAQFLGLPYLWGGTSEKGFDCSGFVQRLCGLHGARLPRDSDQQAACGEPVEPGPDGSGIADGDLAFFAEAPGGRATHVGILAAGGRMLHSSTGRNGVAWDALFPDAPGYDENGARLGAILSAVRRVPGPLAEPASS
jgi:cell wall-associated NlpC family hydrolase